MIARVNVALGPVTRSRPGEPGSWTLVLNAQLREPVTTRLTHRSRETATVSMTEKYVPPHARSAGGAEAGARSAGLGSGQTAVGEEEEEVAEGIEQGGPRERAMARRWVAPIASTSATGVSAVAGGAGRAARQERFDSDSDSDSDSDGWVTDDGDSDSEGDYTDDGFELFGFDREQHAATRQRLLFEELVASGRRPSDVTDDDEFEELMRDAHIRALFVQAAAAIGLERECEGRGPERDDQSPECRRTIKELQRRGAGEAVIMLGFIWEERAEREERETAHAAREQAMWEKMADLKAQQERERLDDAERCVERRLMAEQEERKAAWEEQEERKAMAAAAEAEAKAAMWAELEAELKAELTAEREKQMAAMEKELAAAQEKAALAEEERSAAAARTAALEGALAESAAQRLVETPAKAQMGSPSASPPAEPEMMKMLPEGLATEGDVAQEKKKGKKGKMAAGGAAAQLRRPKASHALVRAREGRHARRLPPDD